MGTEHAGEGPDARLVSLAGRQHGVVSRPQLRRLGLSDRQIGLRTRRGWLRPVHRGVFAAGRTALGREGQWMAAVLAVGPGAVLSHRSAAELWGLLAGCTAPVHVIVPGAGGRRPRAGLALHRAEVPPEAGRRRGIPVTSPAQTLLDLSLEVDRRRLERLVDDAQRRRLCGERELRRFARSRRGARLRALLDDHAVGTTATENDFEELLLSICDRFGIPRPLCQQPVGPYRPDFCWPEQRVIVEADGYATHGTPKAFEDDRERDLELRTLGWEVLRFTWRQLTRRPAWAAGKLKETLTESGARALGR